jgi:hypothetical protein
VGSHPIRLVVADDLRRSRLTVLFRYPLSWPPSLWDALWGAAALLVALVQWVYALAAGRPVARLHAFQARFLHFHAHANAYLRLVANPYPHFAGDAGDYPVDVEVDGPGTQRRWTVALRAILAVPALVLTSVFQTVGLVMAVVSWFIAVPLGRVPRGLRDLGAFLLRYELQTLAYLLVVTDRYPALAAPLPRGPVELEPPPRPPLVGEYI